jgi:hypothetical protein
VSTPFEAKGELIYPPDTGQPNATIPVNVTANFDSKVDYELSLTGSATQSVDMGTVIAPGAKAVLIEVDPDAAASPINVQFNGGGAGGQSEVSPGGFLFMGSPTPTTGITQIDIVHTTNVKVRVRVLG